MSDEADWTKCNLIPLLRRLGFIKVEYTHGTTEHGRDVVFAEIDRFGLLRFYGAQVKMGSLNADRGGVDFREVVAQLNTAWEQPYKDAATGTEHRLSGVYLVVPGNITSVARDRLYEQTGQWLHMVDADQLAVAEHSSWTTISTADRLRLLTMAQIELNSFLTPDFRGLAAALTVSGNEIRLPSVSLTSSGLLRACEILQNEVDPEDFAVLYTVCREAGVIGSTLARIPLGHVSGVEKTLSGLRETIVKSLRYCEMAERILAAARSAERPAPGQLLPRIRPMEWLNNLGEAVKTTDETEPRQ
jgi:hypothetical protein